MAHPLGAIDTPALLVDLDVMERNLKRAADYAAKHKLSLRPHVKTHKSPLIGKQQLALGAVGLTCATPFEAKVMSEIGRDLLIAHPPVGAVKADRVATLSVSTSMTVALDSVRAIEDMSAAAEKAGRTVRVYVELDVGMHRVGANTVDDAIALAKLVNTKASLEYAGIAYYPGHVREPVDSQDAKLKALSTALTEAIDRMRGAGVEPKVVSGGSTPTMWRTHELNGVTEFRPGTYVFNDRTTAAIGACAWEDCAATVLATVVSTAVPGQAVIDAGTKSLGREPVRGVDGEGLGQLLEHPEVIVSRTSEEHGVLDLSRTTWKPEVGDRVRVLPNHVCIVVHLNDIMFGIRKGQIETSWPIAARGRGETRI